MKKLLYVFVVLIAAVACENKHRNVTKRSGADSIVRSVLIQGDYDRGLALIDSFEKAGEMSPINASKRRGETYLQKSMIEEAKAEFKKVVDGTAPQTLYDTVNYISAGGNLVQTLAMQGDFEALLNNALPIIEKVKSFEIPKEYTASILLQKCMLYLYLGYAQTNLDKEQDADKSYEKAYQLSKELLRVDTTWGTYSNGVGIVSNITRFIAEKKNYDKMAYWVEKLDSIVQKVDGYKDMPERYRAGVKASLAGERMGLAVGQNKMDEAKQYYDEFSKTAKAQTVEGRYRCIEYFLAAHRYNEAADMFQNTLGDMVAKYSLEPSYELMEMLAKKYIANVKAGRTDSALAVATFALENLDSAITREKRSEAAKLATIYETQQKDEEIAQQQIELNRQRFLVLAVALVLITTFFIVYTLFRRRAAKRMAEMKAAQERIESELRIARDIQMSMVPSVFPEREGLDMFAQMTPAKEVGGDLYGYVLIGDKLYFAVGDVSGKGVPASLFMAQATRLFRTLATQGMMPAEICTHMNAALTEDNEQGMFVTFFLGLLDLQTGHLAFCNAGHNPPVIGGGENHGDFMQMEANAPIGLFPGVEYKGEEIDTIKGRALFVYTDGLNEAEDTEQNQFGDDKLLAILRDTHFDSARQVIDALFAKVEEHRNGAEPNDDLTMLCLKVS